MREPAQLKARWTEMIAPRLPVFHLGLSSIHCWTWNGLRVGHRQAGRHGAGEGFEIAVIPVVGSSGLVLQGPVQEGIENVDDVCVRAAGGWGLAALLGAAWP